MRCDCEVCILARQLPMARRVAAALMAGRQPDRFDALAVAALLSFVVSEGERVLEGSSDAVVLGPARAHAAGPYH